MSRSVKINPLANPKGVSCLCEICSAPAKLQCPYCRVTYYCSEEHQNLDWEGVHKHICDHLAVIRQDTLIIGSEKQRNEFQSRVNELMTDVIETSKLEATKFLASGECKYALPGALQALKYSRKMYGDKSLQVTPAYLLLGEISLNVGKYKQVLEYMNLAQWQVINVEESTYQRLLENKYEEAEIKKGEKKKLNDGFNWIYNYKKKKDFAVLATETDIQLEVLEEPISARDHILRKNSRVGEENDVPDRLFVESIPHRRFSVIESPSGVPTSIFSKNNDVNHAQILQIGGASEDDTFMDPFAKKARPTSHEVTELDEFMNGLEHLAEEDGLRIHNLGHSAVLQDSESVSSKTRKKKKGTDGITVTKAELYMDRELDGANYLKAKIFLISGRYFHTLKRYNLALKYLSHAAYLFALESGPSDVIATNSYFLIGCVFYDDGKPELSQKIHERVLSIWQRYLLDAIQENKDVFSELGGLQTTEAENMLVHIGNSFLEEYGETDAYTGMSLLVLGLLYAALKEIEPAIDNLNRALENEAFITQSPHLYDDIHSLLATVSSYAGGY
ncbi:hypothetical protein PCE1_001732 [Barthelona sp. PCE]